MVVKIVLSYSVVDKININGQGELHLSIEKNTNGTKRFKELIYSYHKEALLLKMLNSVNFDSHSGSGSFFSPVKSNFA